MHVRICGNQGGQPPRATWPPAPSELLTITRRRRKIFRFKMRGFDVRVHRLVRRCGNTRGTFWQLNKVPAASVLPATQVLADAIHVIVELFREAVSYFSNFFGDRITNHHRSPSVHRVCKTVSIASVNSIGVVAILTYPT